MTFDRDLHSFSSNDTSFSRVYVRGHLVLKILSESTDKHAHTHICTLDLLLYLDHD